MLFANQQERKIEGKVMRKKTDFDQWEETRLNIGMVLRESSPDQSHAEV